jgi:hypothetical protein
MPVNGIFLWSLRQFIEKQKKSSTTQRRSEMMTKNLDDVPQFNMDRFHYFERRKEGYVPLPIIARNTRVKPYSFLLGASDPEMDEIEKLLIENGEAFQYAQYDGVRAEPWNSYMADPIEAPSGTILVLIECEPENWSGEDAIVRIIDHHRPGDAGYNLAPDLFWEASSIGQLYKILRLGEPKREHVVLAAMDHCMTQARLGNCPGISSREVKTLSVEYIAKRRGLDPLAVEACVGTMLERVLDAPRTTIGGQEVADLTLVPAGIGYSLPYLCLLEAVAELSMVALVATKNRTDGPEKIIVCGAATPETVRYFMTSWAPAHGLVDIYGVPARGYAGGYRK